MRDNRFEEGYVYLDIRYQKRVWIVESISEDRTTACVTDLGAMTKYMDLPMSMVMVNGLAGEYEAIQIGRGKRQFLLLPVTKVGRIEYAGRFTRNNRG